MLAYVLLLATVPAPTASAATDTQLTLTIMPLECTVDVVDDGIKSTIHTTSSDCHRALQQAS